MGLIVLTETNIIDCVAGIRATNNKERKGTVAYKGHKNPAIYFGKFEW